MRNVRFLWASDEINAHADEYWTLVMDIARLNNIKRIQRCCTIMGRKEDEEMSAAQIFYPCMQAADVFFLKADICQVSVYCVLYVFYTTSSPILIYIYTYLQLSTCVLILYIHMCYNSWAWIRERSTCSLG